MLSLSHTRSHQRVPNGNLCTELRFETHAGQHVAILPQFFTHNLPLNCGLVNGERQDGVRARGMGICEDEENKCRAKRRRTGFSRRRDCGGPVYLIYYSYIYYTYKRSVAWVLGIFRSATAACV